LLRRSRFAADQQWLGATLRSTRHTSDAAPAAQVASPGLVLRAPSASWRAWAHARAVGRSSVGANGHSGMARLARRSGAATLRRSLRYRFRVARRIPRTTRGPATQRLCRPSFSFSASQCPFDRSRVNPHANLLLTSRASRTSGATNRTIQRGKSLNNYAALLDATGRPAQARNSGIGRKQSSRRNPSPDARIPSAPRVIRPSSYRRRCPVPERSQRRASCRGRWRSAASRPSRSA